MSKENCKKIKIFEKDVKYMREDVFIAEGAVCLGDVAIGRESSIFYHATVRADRERIRIGEMTNIQDNCVVHVDEGFPVTIGDGVTIGHGAVIHGCTIGDNTLVGMGAIILNGAEIGKNCIVGAGALITQNTIVPDNTLMLGSPAKAVRKVTPEEARHNRKNAEKYRDEGKQLKILSLHTGTEDGKIMPTIS